MPNRYAGMSVVDLEEMRAEITEALEEARERETAELAEKLRALAPRGVDVQAWVAGALGKRAPRKAREPNDAPQKPRARGVLPPMYENPHNASQTWSGKGPRPAWFTDALAEGYDEPSMRIPYADEDQRDAEHH